MRRLVLALAFLLVLPATAHADRQAHPSSYNVVEIFSTPSGKINCLMLQGKRGGNAVQCTTNRLTYGKDRSNTRWTFLGASGRAKTRRAFVFQGEAEYSVPYGKTWYLYGGTPKLYGDRRTLRCTSSRSQGMTCRNGSGRGFRLRLSGGREVRTLL